MFESVTTELFLLTLISTIINVHYHQHHGDGWQVNPFASVFLQSVTNVEPMMMLEKVDSPQQHQELEENRVVVVTV